MSRKVQSSEPIGERGMVNDQRELKLFWDGRIPGESKNYGQGNEILKQSRRCKDGMK